MPLDPRTYDQPELTAIAALCRLLETDPELLRRLAQRAKRSDAEQQR